MVPCSRCDQARGDGAQSTELTWKLAHAQSRTKATCSRISSSSQRGRHARIASSNVCGPRSGACPRLGEAPGRGRGSRGAGRGESAELGGALRHSRRASDGEGGRRTARLVLALVRSSGRVAPHVPNTLAHLSPSRDGVARTVRRSGRRHRLSIGARSRPVRLQRTNRSGTSSDGRWRGHDQHSSEQRRPRQRRRVTGGRGYGRECRYAGERAEPGRRLGRGGGRRRAGR